MRHGGEAERSLHMPGLIAWRAGKFQPRLSILDPFKPPENDEVV